MRWVLRHAEPEQVQRLALELALPPSVARLLAVRGIQTSEEAHKFSISLLCKICTLPT